MRDKLLNVIQEMRSARIKVSLFIDPNIDQLKCLEKLEIKPDIIEIHNIKDRMPCRTWHNLLTC